MDEKEYLDRTEVLEKLWNLIWSAKNQNEKACYALAYCEIRNLGFDTTFTLKRKNGS